MKIAAHCGLTRNAGGLFYAVSSLARSLIDEGVNLSVFGRKDEHIDADLSAWGSSETFAYKAIGPLGGSMALRWKLAKIVPDLIHQHGLWQDDQWAALQWQKKTGHPVVISPHGMLDPWAVQNSAWKKTLIGKMFAYESLQRASCIHALCQSEAESIRAYGLKNPIAIIPNGIELPELGGRRTDAGARDGKKRLLFLGRIHPKKGLKELIEAWSKVKSANFKDFSGWKLLIAGWDDGGYEVGLKTLSKQLGEDESIEFAGAQFGEEKEHLLRSVDAFILPSFSEGLPMSVLEAWSYGLPVVMTDFCNIPEGFDSGAAIRIEPNIESISEGLERLAVLSDEKRRNIGSCGRKLVERHFTWDKIAGEMKAVYEWCLGGDKPDFIIED